MTGVLYERESSTYLRIRALRTYVALGMDPGPLMTPCWLGGHPRQEWRGY